MQTYTTIFMDIDNITYELFSHKYMPRFEKEMLEQIIKKGLKSLKGFEVIALLGKDEKYGKNYISKNHLDFIKQKPRTNLENNNNSAYLEYLLKYFKRTKKEVLVVSGNPNMLKTAKSLGIDTCHFNIFPDETLEKTADITIDKLEKLTKYYSERKPLEEVKTEIKNTSSKYHYYMDPKVLKILEERDVILQKTYDSDKTVFLNRKSNGKVLFAITIDLALLKFFKEQGCITCFVNNHYNDYLDYETDYESTIEELPKQLEKLMNK